MDIINQNSEERVEKLLYDTVGMEKYIGCEINLTLSVGSEIPSDLWGEKKGKGMKMLLRLRVCDFLSY